MVRFRDIDKDLLRAVSIGTGPNANNPSAAEETDDNDDEAESSRPHGEHQEDVVLQVDKDINLDSPLLTDLIAALPVSGSPRTSAPRAQLPVVDTHEPNWNW